MEEGAGERGKREEQGMIGLNYIRTTEKWYEVRRVRDWLRLFRVRARSCVHTPFMEVYVPVAVMYPERNADMIPCLKKLSSFVSGRRCASTNLALFFAAFVVW